MAKLKDIFPRWLFKERGFGDLEVGGGSFAHLTEDASSQSLVVPDDWGVYVGPVADDGSATFVGGYAYIGSANIGSANDGAGTSARLFPTGLLASEVASEADNVATVKVHGEPAYRLVTHADGSLHWGSGTAAPDTTLQRYAGGGLVSVGQGISAANTADEGDQQAQIGADGTLYLQGDPSAHWLIIHPDGHVEHAGDSAFRFDNTISVLAHGGGLKLTSPDGTQTKTISIDNTGAIHVA